MASVTLFVAHFFTLEYAGKFSMLYPSLVMVDSVSNIRAVKCLIGCLVNEVLKFAAHNSLIKRELR